MGYKREIGGAILGAAMVVSATRAIAQPGEPLKVTQLGDPESELQAAAVPANSGDPAARAALDDFSRAISDALRAQQQSIGEKCRSSERGSGTIAARWAWEASCRYQRY